LHFVKGQLHQCSHILIELIMNIGPIKMLFNEQKKVEVNV